MSQESDLQGQIDRVWERVGDLSRDTTVAVDVIRRQVAARLKELERDATISGKNEADILRRLWDLERGAKMEAQTSLELRRMIGEVTKRIEALENPIGGVTKGKLKQFVEVIAHDMMVPIRMRLEALEKDALGRPLWDRIEAIDRGWKDHTWASDHAILGRVIALEKRAQAGPVFTNGDNPPNATIYGQLPTCGTCRWFEQDDPTMLFDPKRTGLCQAHPEYWAKRAENTCGEHSPR